jgi:hypothetical protein
MPTVRGKLLYILFSPVLFSYFSNLAFVNELY